MSQTHCLSWKLHHFHCSKGCDTRQEKRTHRFEENNRFTRLRNYKSYAKCSINNKTKNFSKKHTHKADNWVPVKMFCRLTCIQCNVNNNIITLLITTKVLIVWLLLVGHTYFRKSNVSHTIYIYNIMLYVINIIY